MIKLQTTKRRVPKFIAEQYAGGASGFRRNKRAQLREVIAGMKDLRIGCAYFPCGNKPFDDAMALLQEMARSISSRNWGR